MEKIFYDKLFPEEITDSEEVVFIEETDEETAELLKGKKISKEKIKQQFDKFTKKAKKIIEDKDEISKLLQKAVALCGELTHLRLIGKHFTDIALAISMIDDYICKRYTSVPKATIITLTAALLYFITPFDVIPDGIPLIGFADDIIVFSSVLSAAKRDLSAYERWKESQSVQDETEKAE